MELRHLRYFVAVAEELHFGRAAQRVHIAQPPLSHQIRQLEEDIGVSLFFRTKRHVSLTHAGKIFLEEARKILELSEKAVTLARRADRGEIGRLVVSFVGSAAYGFLPSPLQAFRDRFPDVNLVLRELTTTQQVAALRDGVVHVGFLRQPVRDDALNIRTVLQEPFTVALPADHVLSHMPSIELEMLADEQFVMSSRQPGPSFHDQIIALCHQAGFIPRVSQEAVEIATILSLVSVNMGIALVPSSAQNLCITGVAYRPLKGVNQVTELAMAWLRDSESPALNAFVSVVQEMAIGMNTPAGTTA